MTARGRAKGQGHLRLSTMHQKGRGHESSSSCTSAPAPGCALRVTSGSQPCTKKEERGHESSLLACRIGTCTRAPGCALSPNPYTMCKPTRIRIRTRMLTRAHKPPWTLSHTFLTSSGSTVYYLSNGYVSISTNL